MITSSPIGANEATESLTGYDENEIEKRFGADIGTLLEKGVVGLRALAYVLQLRDLKAADVKSPETKAYDAVMSLTMKQIGDFWPDDVDEVVPDEPVTPTGEDDSSAG